MKPRWSGDEAGVTLVELLITLLILGVVGGITTAALVRGLRTSNEVQSRLDTLSELQEVQVAVTRQLRGACPVVAVGPYDTTVKLRRDGKVERHRFSLASGSTDLREDVDVWNPGAGVWDPVRDRVIAFDVDNRTASVPVFAGFERDGTATTVPPDVNHFQLTLRRPVVGDDPVEVSTTVSLRNGDVPCPNDTP